MKMNKIMMLALAGVAFAACSNENEVSNPAPEGVGAVSIRIVSPDLTRAVGAATSGASVTVTPQTGSNVTIKLNASEGGGTITLTPDQWTAGQAVTFWNVKSPTSVEVSMNGGVDMTTDDGKALNIATDLQQAPAAIPVFGKANVTLTADTQTPGESTLDDNHQNGLTGAEGEDDTQYPIYTAEVQLQIPVARLEVSGIKLADAAVAGFQSITIDGVYMDNIKPTVEDALTDYQFTANGGGTGAEAILKDAEGVSFLNATFPDETSKVYAYNFFGSNQAANNPKFKIAFSSIQAAAGQAVLPAKGWAIIENYYSNDAMTPGTEIALENGKIYQITGAELTKDNIVPDENGNTTYAVNVTVKEAAWTVQTTYASWAN